MRRQLIGRTTKLSNAVFDGFCFNLVGKKGEYLKKFFKKYDNPAKKELKVMESLDYTIFGGI